MSPAEPASRNVRWSIHSADLLRDVIRDLRTVWRNGFFIAVLVITGLHIGVLVWAGDFIKPWMVSMVLVEIFTFNGFFLAGVLMLMEKAENSLCALSVSPLSPGRWLLSRCLTLTGLAWAECLVICAVIWPQGLLASVLAAAIATPLLTLLGIAFTARFDGFSEFLMPSVLLFLFLMLPLLYLADLSSHWLFWLHPITPCVALLKSGYQGMVLPVTALALILGTVWMVLAFGLARGVSRTTLAWSLK